MALKCSWYHTLGEWLVRYGDQEGCLMLHFVYFFLTCTRARKTNAFKKKHSPMSFGTEYVKKNTNGLISIEYLNGFSPWGQFFRKKIFIISIF